MISSQHTIHRHISNSTLPSNPLHNADKKNTKETHRISTNLRILFLEVPVLRPRYVNHAINNRMSNMHALRPKFPSQTLRQGSHSELACREGGTESGAPQGGCCAREDERWRVCEVGGVEEEGEDGLGEEVGTTSVEERVAG